MSNTTDKQNVLLIGGGGREHALAHVLSRSPRLGRLFILPGNAGTAALGKNIAGSVTDAALALEVARRENIDLTIVGPEDPLAAGFVDRFAEAGRRVFGPPAIAARLEADKAFAKQLMRQYAVPTAEARVFEDFKHARQYIATRDEGLVVKAAGLCRGKGVVVCPDPAEALIAAENMLVHRHFGDAGAKIVVEERLEGREASLMCLIDGRNVYVLDPAQDYKRLHDGDAGPNTGGMGSFCPSPAISAAAMKQIESQILVPMLDALVRQELAYRGVLYVGLMLTAGGPKVLEFNCRFGDPETQVVLPRLRSCLIDLIEATLDGRLDGCDVAWDARSAVCVVLASEGYPDAAVTGRPISGLDGLAPLDDLFVFHAGTRREAGRIVTSGGRVLGVTGLGESIADARARAYDGVSGVRFDGMQYRTDIGA